jgi:large subunit ribosomal protein L19
MKATRYTKETIREIGIQNSEFPTFGIGDTVVVSQLIKEEAIKVAGKKASKDAPKERIQLFEGDVIAIHKNGASSTFTVRKIAAHSIAVERIFPFSSPIVKGIKVLGKGDVRRAKLYYLRKRVGKAAQVKKLVETKAAAASKQQAAAGNAQSE